MKMIADKFGKCKELAELDHIRGPTQLFYEGRIENRPIGMAECMNSYFVNKIENLIANLDPSEADPLSNSCY